MIPTEPEKLMIKNIALILLKMVKRFWEIKKGGFRQWVGTAGMLLVAETLNF